MPDQAPGMRLFEKKVNRSIALPFSQEVPSLVFEYASLLSATAICIWLSVMK